MHDFFKLYIHSGSTYGLTVTDLSNEFVLRAVKHPILYINARSLRMYHALMHWRIPQHRCTLSANRPATIPTQQQRVPLSTLLALRCISLSSLLFPNYTYSWHGGCPACSICTRAYSSLLSLIHTASPDTTTDE